MAWGDRSPGRTARPGDGHADGNSPTPRGQRGLSLAELARQAGLAKQTLSNLEQGARNPTGGHTVSDRHGPRRTRCPAGGRFLGGEPRTALGHFRADPGDALTDGRGV
ncbi:helix-turn-helix domain-containing protein [Streptomyces sp. NPDC006365]|uniref:helix-turn-helix domain-containing protein n=1 Tax=Streptomyces sp. NPDC006365 TaxID=3364744 RepID=UPI00367AC50A